MAQTDADAALALVKEAMRQTLQVIMEEYGTYVILETDTFTGDPFVAPNPAADAFAAGVAVRLGLTAIDGK